MSTGTRRRPPPNGRPEAKQWHERVPPQNIDAEKHVQAAAMLEPELFAEAAAILLPDNFYLGSHQHIFAALLKLRSEVVRPDPITIGEMLEKVGQLKDVGGFEYLHSIMESQPHGGRVKSWAKIV